VAAGIQEKEIAGTGAVKHSFLDRYSDRDSFIHKLDPRTKFIIAVLFILAVVLTPPGNWPVFSAYLVIIAALLLFSKVPILHVIKRSLVILPFVVLIAIFLPFFKGNDIAGSYNIWLWQVNVTHSGIAVLVNVVIKAWLSALSLIWLTSTTSMTGLLHGMERLRLPRVMVMLLSFMYRYIFVLVDEVMRMKQARDSRNFGGKRLFQIRSTGNMIGTLFIRSYERGERVYASMVARGFDGQVRTLNQFNFGPADAGFGITCGLLLIIIVVFSQIY
jgi:cobalt/nickel transport system permease protein